MSFLELRGIAKRFGATAALNGIDLDVEAGEVHALIGENGAGKSTLVNILAGTFRADQGQMRLAGAPYVPRSPADSRRAGVALIHQELSLCPHLSVAENIGMGAEPSTLGVLDRTRLRHQAARLLSEFGSGQIDPQSRTGDLPLADRQIVEICRALACDARVLLMDEATSALERGDIDRLFRLVRQLQARGIAILYISHFLEEIREIAGRYTVLRDGERVDSGELAPVSDEELIARMVGRRLDETLDRAAATGRASNEVVLEVRDLAAPPRLKSASFDLHKGEILGVAGLVGSGRTDMVRALFGLARATAGRIRLGGRELAIGRSRPARRTLEGFGYLSEDRKGEGLALQLSVADNITLSRLSSCARAGWIDRNRQASVARSLAERLRVKTPGPATRVSRLSGGNQQKVALARLLHQNPDVLLLDEPARGIDVSSKSDIFREIRGLAARGKAILMISSYLPELLAVCDSIAVMSRGRLSPARPVASWTAETILQAAIRGT